ncbi:RNA polymerase sigma factor (sigma-70 family) [Paenibacillus phyllosphaerae]|uniref:RNA polymerase sigma factor (Sigma-70 family) n=1 Tax=Paenibacillus phyllosphaerae TaxID=274593 RepID=A0A7W5FR56_9BACL|nr:sigma-70 family RNA polymerase sigma factor [Paenibacillus phyllosphaerae]MBB3113937.1 RNA polymerase sigma factor (sigma-70 family) [Paenibacillus phyllosphaerae]
MQPNHHSFVKPEFAACQHHPILQSFCAYPEHAALVLKAMEDASPSHLEQLNRAFRIYLFALRFTKYMRSLIMNGRIDYVRRMKKNEERELVIYDKPVSEEEEAAIGEMLTAIYHGDNLPQVTVNPDVFLQQLDNEYLYDGFSRLTSRQQYVITLAYSALSRDSEIAHLLHVTQQAVSKTRTKALQKIRESFPPYATKPRFKIGG